MLVSWHYYKTFLVDLVGRPVDGNFWKTQCYLEGQIIVKLGWLNLESWTHVFENNAKRTIYLHIANHHVNGLIISHAAASMLTSMDDEWKENVEGWLSIGLVHKHFEVEGFKFQQLNMDVQIVTLENHIS